MTNKILIKYIEDLFSLGNRGVHIGPDNYINGNKVFTFEYLIEKGYSVIPLTSSDLLQIRS